MTDLKKLMGDGLDCSSEEFADYVEALLKDVSKFNTNRHSAIDAAETLLRHYKELVLDGAEDHCLICLVLDAIVRLAVGFLVKNEPVKLLKETLIKKNQDYGNSAIKSGGILGNYVRMSDKVSRLRSLSKTQQVNFESLTDTWLDLAGYAVIGLIIIDLMESA